MTDLISRADAIEAIMKHYDGGLNQINYGLALAKNEIRALPSADAVSREFYEDAVKANIGLVIENRKLKEQIESAEAVPTIPMFAESEEAYKAWTGEEMGKTSDEINEMNKEILKDILKMMPTAYLLEALGVATFEELMESAEPSGDLISRKKAKEEIYLLGRNSSIAVIWDCLDALPSADRPHGEWIVEPFRNNWEFKCSICGWYEYHAYKDTQRHNYCPNCGAKMGGDGE